MSQRALGFMLALSLALNAYFGGQLLADWLRPQPDRRAPEMAAERLLSRLPQAERPVLERALAQRADRLSAAQLRVTESRNALRVELAREVPDAGALAATCARLRQDTGAFYAELHGALVAAAPQLSPHARRALLRHPKP